jgi:putative addiction module component (TIGR02574 family)
MPSNVEQILHDALALPAIERASIVESLLSSLDRPDPRVDALWADEAEDRLAAFRDGTLRAASAEDVFKRLERR